MSSSRDTRIIVFKNYSPPTKNFMLVARSDLLNWTHFFHDNNNNYSNFLLLSTRMINMAILEIFYIAYLSQMREHINIHQVQLPYQLFLQNLFQISTDSSLDRSYNLSVMDPFKIKPVRSLFNLK